MLPNLLFGGRKDCSLERPVLKLFPILITFVAINFLSKVSTAPVFTTETTQFFSHRLVRDAVQAKSMLEPKSQQARPASKNSPIPEPQTSSSPKVSPKQKDSPTSDSTHPPPPPPRVSPSVSTLVSSRKPEVDPDSTQPNTTPSNSRPPETQSVQTAQPDLPLKSPPPKAKPSQSKLPSPEPTVTPIPQQKPPGTGSSSGEPRNSDVSGGTSEDPKDGRDEKAQSDGSGQDADGSSPLSTLQTVSPLFIIGAGLLVLVVVSIFIAFRSGLCLRLQSTFSDQPYEPVSAEPSPPTARVNTTSTVDADGWNQDWDNDDWDIDDHRTKHEQTSSQMC